MKRRGSIKLSVAVLSILAVALAVYCWQRARLGGLRRYLEATYSNQISLIEQRSRAWDAKDIDLQMKFEEEIRTVVSSNEIYATDWSTDGHHGLQAFKVPPRSISTFAWPSSASPDGLHSLSYGLTGDWQILLVFTGQVPVGKKRQYQLVFVLHGIEQKSLK